MEPDKEPRKGDESPAAEFAVGYAVVGCLVVGTIALIKTFNMTPGVGLACVVLSAVAAFGMVYWIHTRKN